MPDELLRPNSDNALAQNAAQPPAPKPLGKARKRRSFGEFMNDLFIKNSGSFLHHVLYGILRPRTIDVVDDILKDGIDRMLHPQDSRYPDDYYRRRDQNRPYDSVSYRYDTMYDSRTSSTRYEPERYDRTPDPRSIEFDNSSVAREVLEDMKYAIYEERFCTIQQFYEFARRRAGVNITPNYTDNYYGWSDLGGVRPEMTYNGKYTLRLPPTERA